MKRLALLLIFGAGLALAIAATDQPDNAPGGREPVPLAAPAPSVQSSRSQLRPVSPPPAMPETFEVVARRNIFIKGEQLISPDSPDSTGAGGPNGASRVMDNRPPPPSQNDLLLSGVSVTNTGRVAFLEDVQASRETEVHVGDSVPMGKITRITLDAIDYQNSSGQVVHVYVGDGLLGGHVESLSQQPTTQPSDDDNPVLRRLRQRHLEELGGRPD